MSKFGKLTEENQKLVTDVVDNLGLCNYLNVEANAVKKSKTLIKVSKAGDRYEYATKKPSIVCIDIYEEAFDRLDEDNKKLLIEDALNSISYDFEKDKINIGVPSVTVTIGGRQKYGEKLINAAEIGVMMIQQIAEEEKERKEQEKMTKKPRKK